MNFWIELVLALVSIKINIIFDLKVNVLMTQLTAFEYNCPANGYLFLIILLRPDGASCS